MERDFLDLTLGLLERGLGLVLGELMDEDRLVGA